MISSSPNPSTAAIPGRARGLKQEENHDAKALRRHRGHIVPDSLLLRAQAVSFLLDSGADPEAPLLSGFTPLLYALSKGDSESAMILMEKGADYRRADRFGDDPLNASKKNPDPAVREYLSGLVGVRP
jgi:ankyrin repeat protein